MREFKRDCFAFSEQNTIPYCDALADFYSCKQDCCGCSFYKRNKFVEDRRSFERVSAVPTDRRRVTE